MIYVSTYYSYGTHNSHLPTHRVVRDDVPFSKFESVGHTRVRFAIVRPYRFSISEPRGAATHARVPHATSNPALFTESTCSVLIQK